MKDQLQPEPVQPEEIEKVDDGLATPDESPRKRGVGYTRKDKKENKKAKRMSKNSRRINRTK